MKRVVITGIGLVTPLGNDLVTTWENLKAGLSGIGPITKFNPGTQLLTSRIAGEVKDFQAEQYIPRKEILRLDPFIHYATAASLMALEDSGITLRNEEHFRTGVIIGSSRGGIISMERAAEKHFLKGKPFSAYLMSSSTINMAPSYIAMRTGIRGPSIGISTACASGTNAIGEAMKMIRNGEIESAIAGGAEAPVCRLAVGGYGTAGALSRRNNDPEKASRPFDKERDGFVLSEGAGIVVLEEHERAVRRGANIYAEVAGYSTSSDAFHQTKPNSTGEAIAIRSALHDARVPEDCIDYINAHATSTVLGDSAEARAIREVFARKTDVIPVSSCKSMLGHMLGGAGAVEVAVTALSISRSTVIPAINLETPAQDCNLNHVTSKWNGEIRCALTHSFGFGGVNAVLVLKNLKKSEQ
ncbi:MAG: beta-ketoacyl-[acyl-carrier-protein] synthase II [Nitrospiraceae bacterium]|nr:MAG: beta-ketoacyl-[acyl-carrier-protein] synthase II [Nitrospiraceae bacterium]